MKFPKITRKPIQTSSRSLEASPDPSRGSSTNSPASLPSRRDGSVSYGAAKAPDHQAPAQQPVRQNVRIALPTPNSLPDKSQTIPERQQRMESYLESSQKLFADAEQSSGRKTTNVFMGPEYMYDARTPNAQHRPGEIRQLSQGQYHNIDRMNADLSKKYPDTVFKPGSVAYAMPTSRPTELNAYLASKGIHDESHPDREKYVQRFTSNPEKYSSKGNQLYLDPQFTQLNPESRINKADSKYQNVSQQFPKSELQALDGQETHLAKNKTNTYLNGERISSYSKMSNSNEVQGTPPGFSTKMVPGTEQGGRHRINDKEYSQELCLDALTVPQKAAPGGHFTQSDFVPNKNVPLDKYSTNQTAFHAHSSTVLQDPNTKEDIHGVFKFDEAGNRVKLKPIAEHNGVQLWDIDESQADKVTKPTTTFENFDDLFGKPKPQDMQEQADQNATSAWGSFKSFFK